MNPARQVDLQGSISASDGAGRTLRVQGEGAVLKIDADSTRAALSALAALKALRARGSVEPLAPQALQRLSDFRIELCVRGRLVGRAGLGAQVNWLGRAFTALPLELHLPALLRAAVLAF